MSSENSQSSMNSQRWSRDVSFVSGMVSISPTMLSTMLFLNSNPPSSRKKAAKKLTYVCCCWKWFFYCDECKICVFDGTVCSMPYYECAAYLTPSITSNDVCYLVIRGVRLQSLMAVENSRTVLLNQQTDILMIK